MMDTLDLIISLDTLSFPAAKQVFNLVDALRISSSVNNINNIRNVRRNLSVLFTTRQTSKRILMTSNVNLL